MSDTLPVHAMVTRLYLEDVVAALNILVTGMTYFRLHAAIMQLLLLLLFLRRITALGLSGCSGRFWRRFHLSLSLLLFLRGRLAAARRAFRLLRWRLGIGGGLEVVGGCCYFLCWLLSLHSEIGEKNLDSELGCSCKIIK